MAYTNNLHVVYGEASLGVNGQDFAYLFSYERGGLESLKNAAVEDIAKVPGISHTLAEVVYKALRENQ